MKPGDRGNIDALLAALAKILAGEGRAGGRQASLALERRPRQLQRGELSRRKVAGR